MKKEKLVKEIFEYNSKSNTDFLNLNQIKINKKKIDGYPYKCLFGQKGRRYNIYLKFSENVPKNYKYKIIVLKTHKQIFKTKNKNITYYSLNNILNNPFILFLWELFFLTKILETNNVRVYFSPGGIISSSLNKLNIKKITMFRNMIPFDKVLMKQWPLGYARLRNWLLSKQLRSGMIRADKVIFISKFGYSVIKKLGIEVRKKNILIYHGINKQFFYQRKNLKMKLPFKNIISKDSYIIYPSIIDIYKCQKEVVIAYSLLKNNIKTKISKLLLVGEEYGSYSKYIRDLIKFYKLEKDIFVTGPADHRLMPALYKYADFTIFASKSENCPNILLEAMASGSGIICSNAKPMREFAAIM